MPEKTSFDRRALLVRSGAAAVGAVGVTVAGGALAAPAMAAGAGYTPITPFRSWDSRELNERIRAGEAYTFEAYVDMQNVARIPSNAAAITFNLTVTRTAGAGYLTVAPGNATSVEVSTINWVQGGIDLANGGTIGLAAAGGSVGSVAIFCGGGAGAATDFILDVTGYYS